MEKKRVFRYIVFGGCTTAVNLGTFWILENLANWSVLTANLFSIVLAILFAFVGNRWFVFERTTRNNIGTEFIRFVGMRGATLAVELFGVEVLSWLVPAFLAKAGLQIGVIILNYVISKYYVFQEGGYINGEN